MLSNHSRTSAMEESGTRQVFCSLSGGREVLKKNSRKPSVKALHLATNHLNSSATLFFSRALLEFFSAFLISWKKFLTSQSSALTYVLSNASISRLLLSRQSCVVKTDIRPSTSRLCRQRSRS